MQLCSYHETDPEERTFSAWVSEGASLAYMLSGPLNSVLLSLLGDIPFGYLLFGLPGVMLLLLSV